MGFDAKLVFVRSASPVSDVTTVEVPAASLVPGDVVETYDPATGGAGYHDRPVRGRRGRARRCPGRARVHPFRQVRHGAAGDCVHLSAGGQAMSRTALAWSVTLMAAAFATALAWGPQPLSVALMAAALITPTCLDQEDTTHD